MKVAIILYGQPRDYVNGHSKIMEYCNNQLGYTFDFFYHCWIIQPNQVFNVSPWRNIHQSTIIYNEQTPEHLKELYSPLACEYENQNDIKFDISLYHNTIAYNNSPADEQQNIHNFLFQLYSRNQARNIFNSYLKENPVEYKCVMTLRFDTLRMPSLNFNELDLSNTNMSDLHLPKRYIFSDSCIITTVEKYLEWFTIFEDLNKMINNTELDILVKSYNETLSFSPESLIFAKYLLHYKNLSNIGYFKYGFF